MNHPFHVSLFAGPCWPVFVGYVGRIAGRDCLLLDR